MPEHNWLKEQYNSLHELDSLTFELIDYSQSFYATGNIIMAKNLTKITNDMSEMIKKIRNATNQCFNEQIERSNESSNTMLLATLSGIRLGQTKKGNK